jgi:hypothetical protein
MDFIQNIKKIIFNFLKNLNSSLKLFLIIKYGFLLISL